jgi:hypothetical protein
MKAIIGITVQVAAIILILIVDVFSTKAANKMRRKNHQLAMIMFR